MGSTQSILKVDGTLATRPAWRQLTKSQKFTQPKKNKGVSAQADAIQQSESPQFASKSDKSTQIGHFLPVAIGYAFFRQQCRIHLAACWIPSQAQAGFALKPTSLANRH
jgi:hypothetical protein